MDVELSAPPIALPSSMCKRKHDEEDDDDNAILGILPNVPGFGNRKRRFWHVLRSPGAWNEDSHHAQEHDGSRVG